MPTIWASRLVARHQILAMYRTMRNLISPWHPGSSSDNVDIGKDRHAFDIGANHLLGRVLSSALAGISGRL